MDGSTLCYEMYLDFPNASPDTPEGRIFDRKIPRAHPFLPSPFLIFPFFSAISSHFRPSLLPQFFPLHVSPDAYPTSRTPFLLSSLTGWGEIKWWGCFSRNKRGFICFEGALAGRRGGEGGMLNERSFSELGEHRRIFIFKHAEKVATLFPLLPILYLF